MSMPRWLVALLLAAAFFAPLLHGQGTGAPKIIGQPQSQAVVQGSAALFSVVASGAEPLSYEWRKDGVPIPSNIFSIPPVPTLPTFRVGGLGLEGGGGVTFRDLGEYTVRVRNSQGEAISNPATLSLALGGRQLSSGIQTVAQGGTVAFEVEGVGENLRYQWLKNGVAVPYATAPRLVLSSLGIGDGDRYSVNVSNDLGSINAGSIFLTIAVPPRIGLQPANQDVDAGLPFTLQVAAFGSAPQQYQWFKGTAAVVGATGSSLTNAQVQPTDAGLYRVVVKNSAGEVSSNEASVTVRQPSGLPVFTVLPSSQRALLGSAVTLNGAASWGTSSLRYGWFHNGVALSSRSPTLGLSSVRASDAGAWIFTVAGEARNAPVILSQPAVISLVNTSYYTFTTVAGFAHAFGALDGPVAAASFAQPMGIALDLAGNIFVADTQNRLIRKITPAGEVSLLAGGGFSATGNGDGLGRNTRFNFPTGVATDEAGNVYVADSGNATIRKISSQGEVVTFAGSNGLRGAADGVGAEARFEQPQAIAVGTGGIVYVADVGNSTIRKITPSGPVTTLAGLAGSVGSVDGVGTAARFNRPEAIAVDRAGNVFVADTGNHVIRRIAIDGHVTTLAGLPGDSGVVDGSASAARFSRPQAITVDATGNLFVAEGANTIRKITVSGEVSTIGGNTLIDGGRILPDSTDGTGADAVFRGPSGIVADDRGRLFIVETAHSSVRMATPPDGGEIPLITIQPVAQTVALGADAVLAVVATSATPLNYQWLKNGIYVSGSTAATLTLSKVQGTAAGRYTVLVQNRSGLGISNSVDLAVTEPTSISSGPVTQRLPTDGNATLSVVAPQPPVSTDFRVPPNLATIVYYQWLRDGVIVDGATSATFVTNQAGSYRVLVGNSVGSIVSAEALVIAPAAASRLSNLSVRARAGVGAQSLLVGFVTSGGSDGSATPLLLRAIGPSLAGFGIADFLSDPVLKLYQGTTLVAANDNWGENAAQLTAIGARVGAFALGNATSLDAALYDPALRPNAYTAQVAAAHEGTGTALAELYDAIPPEAPSGSSARLVNVSARAFVTSTNALIAGFSISGRAPKRVLVRAIGPSLAGFGVVGVLERPQLTLYSDASIVGANADWRADSDQVFSSALRVGGFTLDYRNADAALVITLVPGTYTAVITGLGNTSGIALIEVYDVEQ